MFHPFPPTLNQHAPHAGAGIGNAPEHLKPQKGKDNSLLKINDLLIGHNKGELTFLIQQLEQELILSAASCAKDCGGGGGD
jgi:hypothetical protein